MRRTLSHLFAALVGGAIVAAACTSRETPDRTGDRIDLTQEFTVQPPGGSVRTYRPHSVVVDNDRRFVADPATDTGATVIRFEGGRVQIAATTAP